MTGKLPSLYNINTNNFLIIKPICVYKLCVISTFPSRTCVVGRHGAEGNVLLCILCVCKLLVYDKKLHIARNVHQNTNNLTLKDMASYVTGAGGAAAPDISLRGGKLNSLHERN